MHMHICYGGIVEAKLSIYMDEVLLHLVSLNHYNLLWAGVAVFHKMGVLTSLFLLISVAASEGANLQGEWVSPSITYWHQKLPTTAIPETLRELISADGDKVAVKVGKGGVSVNVGTPPRKAGTPAPKSKGKGVGMSVKRCVANINYAADAHMVTDPLLCMFLLETDLHSGTKVPLHLVPNAQKMHFLPRAVADEIPFSSDKLSVALKELNISKDSDMALAMKETLQVCERPALKGESKYCATSLESMIDYTTSKLGSNRVTVLATNVRKTSNSVTREYSITGVKYESRVEEKSMLYYCHSRGYAYAVYLCHDLQGSRAARVWVRGEDGSTVEAVAVCHTDTSTWNPHHVAFQVLNVKPGGASVCHFAPQGDVLWLAAA